MSGAIDNKALILLVGLVALICSGCGAWSSAPSTHAPPSIAAGELPSDDVSEMSIRFLEDRVKRDPEDFIAYNKLAGYYQQRLRETGDLTYLNLASRAARASLGVLPAEQNIGGLTALALTEYASHDFAGARDHATRLTQLEPGKSYPYEILGDALLELGDYNQAETTLRKMEQLGVVTVNTVTRLARLALLHGEVDIARRRFALALARASEGGVRRRETIAWCQWQLGELAFSTGDYAAAEQRYREALSTFPNYFRALASLGRVRAAKGDRPDAMAQYEHAVRVLPDPVFVGALGDLYKLDGRETDAAQHYALVEHIGHLSTLNGALYNRQLALFYADHDMKPAEAVSMAEKELQFRKDIYGSDALGWAYYKASRYADARNQMKQALRLGTLDPLLFYHAGMIERDSGNQAEAKRLLKKALELSPRFHPVYAPRAEEVVAKLR